MSIALGISASESLSATGNIFMGQIEAPLVIKPFLSDMTNSELHAVMAGGFSTVAGSILGVYISFGIDPTALLAASAMSAPAALAVTKLLYPETEISKTDFKVKESWDLPRSKERNIIHALSNGAFAGAEIVIKIAANLISILAIIKMLDAWLLYMGSLIDIHLTFNSICEVIFYPLAWLIGIDNEDLRIGATLIGYKVLANEFVAFHFLSFFYKDVISPRSYYILSFALCGFANVGSVGVQVASLSHLAPERKSTISKLAYSAVIAGNIASYMTACVAGLFYEMQEE